MCPSAALRVTFLATLTLSARSTHSSKRSSGSLFTDCGHGYAAWEKGAPGWTYDVSFINHKALTSDFCAETAVSSFPFTTWHRSENTGFIAGVTSQPSTRFADFGTLNFGFFSEFGDAILGMMGGAETACGEAVREWLCYNVQPQSRFEPVTETRSSCPVCRSVCETYVKECEFSARETLLSAGLGILLPHGLSYLSSGLCDLNERSVAEHSLANLLHGNCSNYPVTTGGCTSGDASTCEQLPVAPAAVFGAHGFRDSQATADDNVFFSNEVQDQASQEGAPSELRSQGTGVRLDGHGSIMIPSGSTLTLTGAAAQPRTKLAGRVNQYTAVSYLPLGVNKLNPI